MSLSRGQSRAVENSDGRDSSSTELIVSQVTADIDGMKLRNSVLEPGSRICAHAIVTSHGSIHLRDRSTLLSAVFYNSRQSNDCCVSCN